jgi:hypothetical protein
MRKCVCFTFIFLLSACKSVKNSSTEKTAITNDTPPGTNTAPVVNAGSDTSIVLPISSVLLSGTVLDDGLPAGSSLSYQWSKISGAGNVSFTNVNSLSTNATFSLAGNYILRLSASDGALASTDDVQVVVNSASSGGSGGSGTSSFPWSGILTQKRATDWSQAGIPGGIPLHTGAPCADVASGETTTNIQKKMDACPKNGVVKFGVGTFNLDTSIFANKGIVLRGSGPKNTKINLVGGNIFLGTFGSGGLGGYPTNLGATNWTGGLSKGSTTLTFDSTSGIVDGQRIILDQRNSSYVFTNGIEKGVDGHCYPENSCGRNDNPLQTYGSDNRAQLEIVEIEHILSSTQLKIKAPGVAYDHLDTLGPQAFWWNTFGESGPGSIKFAGVEDMSINANGQDDAISMPWCDYCWVKNVAVTNIARTAVLFQWGMHDEVRDSYFSASNSPGGPTEYGIEVLNTTFAKIENNIFFGITSDLLAETSYGLVVGYNYVLNTATGAQFGAFATHLSHNYLQLSEGNVAAMILYDNSWGSASHNTTFRNRMSGNSPGKTNYRLALSIGAHNHYMNVVGNVLGDPTHHTRYRCDNVDSDDADNYIFDLGFWNSCQWGIASDRPYDSLTQSSLMRWANWDAVTWIANAKTNGVRYCTGAGTGNPDCTVSETASTDPTFPGLANPSTVLPASFYLTAKPTWFGNVQWPPIGPDVNCISNCNPISANHAAMIPAQLCYINAAKDAGGFLTAFDANSCY